jgi:hypothetical protein
LGLNGRAGSDHTFPLLKVDRPKNRGAMTSRIDHLRPRGAARDQGDGTMLKTPLCKLLGIEVPIILAPMGTATSAMKAARCRAL